MNDSRKKILPLETLRGLAALCVACFHFGYDSHLTSRFIENAWLMVDFFFVLSGFVIAINYTNISTYNELYRFQKRRLLRLYPLHILTLLFFLGLETLKLIEESYFSIGSYKDAFTVNSPLSFVYNILLLQSFCVDGLTWNYPSWSISAEFYTYLGYGLALLLTRNRLLAKRMAIAAVIASSGFSLSQHGFHSATDGWVRCFFSFSLGCVIADAYHSTGMTAIFKTSISSLAMIALSIWLITYHDALGLPTLLLPVVFAATIFTLSSTNRSSNLYRALETPVLVHLGTISYGIYMIHATVEWIATRTLRFIFDFPVKPKDNGEVLRIENVWVGDALIISCIGIVIILSHFSHHYFEKPFVSGARTSRPEDILIT